MSDTSHQPYRVLARKYRPASFDDLIGQAPMVRTLSNAFRAGRIAQAYMLTGVRGVGKTTTARILARALNYKTPEINQPTIDLKEEGEHCRAIMEGRHVDVIEMDAASHTGIDDIREIIESVQYAPAIARYKVYIIDEVHMLSRNAFNGLLKTLEEPPVHLKFIFATTEIRKVPVTVLSRCQRFDLRRIDSGLMLNHLKKICASEGIEAEDEALAMVARASEGSARDALSMLDQAIAHAEGTVEASGVRSMLGLADRSRVIDLFEHVMKGDISAALAEMKDQYDIGADPYVVLTDLGDFIHQVTRLKYTGGSEGPGSNSGLSETEISRAREFAGKLSVRVLGRAWQILLKGLTEIQSSERALAAADMVLVRLTHAVDLPGHDELVAQLQAGSGSPASATSGQTAGSSGTGPAADEVSGGGSGGGSSTVHSPARSPVMAPSMSAGQIAGSSGGKTGAPAISPAGPRLAATNPAPRAEKAESGAPAIRTVRTFDELIFLAEDMRDLKAKMFLRSHVRLVSISHGKLIFNLAGHPPSDSMAHLGAKLKEWTGTQWQLMLSDEDGLPTLEEIEQAENRDRMERARAHPAVSAIMKAFDGARIVDVRIRQQEEVIPEAAPEDEEDDGSGLDDFFE
jgi:DNA polymerase-3 subunit gamma/tau